MNTIWISVIALIFLVLFCIFLFKKLDGIKMYNILIFAFLSLMWLVLGVYKQNVIVLNTSSTWAWPCIIATMNLTQAIMRLPFGKLSQKLNSRNTVILIALGSFLFLTIPFLIKINLATIFVLSIGIGIFAATFGLDNQYWSENWKIQKVFISTAIIALIPELGNIISKIVFSPEKIIHSSKMIVEVGIIFLVVGILVLIFYGMFVENKATIRLENLESTSESHKLSTLKLYHVLLMSIGMACISILFNSLNRNFMMNFSSKTWSLLNQLIGIIIIMTSLLATLFLIRFISAFILLNIGNILVIISSFAFIFMAVFHYDLALLKIVFLILLAIGISTYQSILIGTMLHFDHKNSLLVLGIWLSIRSFAMGTGDIIGGEIEVFHLKQGILIISIVSGCLSVIALVILIWTYFSKTKIIYKTIDKSTWTFKDKIHKKHSLN